MQKMDATTLPVSLEHKTTERAPLISLQVWTCTIQVVNGMNVHYLSRQYYVIYEARNGNELILEYMEMYICVHSM